MESIEQKNNPLDTVFINNELYFKITDVDAMRPFFMSIVSDSNHWLFIASNGGITAGRKNAQFALFPYYTDDKVTESAEITGSKSIFKITTNSTTYIWEPFSIRQEGRYRIQRNIYQNKWCNKVLFEEINIDLQVSFQYQWSTSNMYGFVKQSSLINHSNNHLTIEVLDGLQNIMPYGVPSDLQTTTSNLADAYKRSELATSNGIGIYALSAIIVDKAEPAEALKANIVWSKGLQNVTYLVSSRQLHNFRTNKNIEQETDVKGEKGAYFTIATITLPPQETKQWCYVANVNQTHADIISLAAEIESNTNIISKLQLDIDAGTTHLQQLTGAADSFQYTADTLKDTRHYSNVLFNIMRGGIFDNNYLVEKWDFELYLQKANKQVYTAIKEVLQTLPNTFTIFQLQTIAQQTNNSHFIRLATEYLPLKFSRRHGDPSRPWNQFSINTRSEIDGSKILDYQGNWRDIFQNWEALAHAYPAFIEGMITKFLNASTFDGYNPYRVTKDGFDWETIETDNPWSYIGYWGDHQIIYLLKFLEFAEQKENGFIANNIHKKHFVYANVPYKIKPYEAIVKNPKDTITYDYENEKQIHTRTKLVGADGALLTNLSGEIYTVNFIEKILATTLAKLSNFIPEAGIWMNTQRPEWNDANNALVGNGVSMVTLYYLRRFLHFLQQSLSTSTVIEVEISEELAHFLNTVAAIFTTNIALLDNRISNIKRKEIVDALGTAGSNFRNQIYTQSFSTKTSLIKVGSLIQFIKEALLFIDHSIKANKRTDHLYHAYNLVSFKNDELVISYLSEMLEGQVAVLSAGYLTANESVQLLDALKASALYRPDQNSYILYPNKELPTFLAKNNIPNTAIQQSTLLQQLLKNGNTSIIEKDINGGYHFNGNFKNADDVAIALQHLPEPYKATTNKEIKEVLEIFETVFNHKEFTGRSGTFFAFEGLGSIYWHMVSKLAVAVQETCLLALQNNASANTIDKLIQHYYAVVDGIGVHKSPALFGAFPITPYSHTPLHKGAQQPGMTGQVKEDIITRMGELGVHIQNGELHFNPQILLKQEFIQAPTTVHFVTVNGSFEAMQLPAKSIAFTICQVPIIYTIAATHQIDVNYTNGAKESFNSNALSKSVTEKISNRTGEVSSLIVSIVDISLR